MASAELSRRVERVVGYPPLSEMGDDQRRESKRRYSRRTRSRICRGSGRRRSSLRSRTRRTCGSSTATEPGLQHLSLPPEAMGFAHGRERLDGGLNSRPRQSVQGRDRALKKAGLRRIRFHDLRHCFGSAAITTSMPTRCSRTWATSTTPRLSATCTTSHGRRTRLRCTRRSAARTCPRTCPEPRRFRRTERNRHRNGSTKPSRQGAGSLQSRVHGFESRRRLSLVLTRRSGSRRRQGGCRPRWERASRS
jgi:hypothetical protein